jgi:DNA-binding NarL/FixJ family response regulator
VAIRVLLVDDQPLLRTGFRMILEAEQDIAVVGEAGDGLQALDQVRALQPDVVLMDIRMPRMDGVEATRQITGPGRDGPAKVLVLTTFDLDEYVVEALRAGASGFLLKDAPANELVQAIRVVAAGEAMLAPSITRRLLDKYATHLPSGDEPAPTRGCSPRCSSMSISSDALRTAWKAASATASAGPAKVITLRLWSASACVSSTAAPGTPAIVAAIASITSRRRPSLKLGMHSIIARAEIGD